MQNILNMRIDSINELIKNLNKDLKRVKKNRCNEPDNADIATIEKTIEDSKIFMEAYCNRLTEFLSNENATFDEYKKLFTEDDKEMYKILNKYNSAIECLKNKK